VEALHSIDLSLIMGVLFMATMSGGNVFTICSVIYDTDVPMMNDYKAGVPTTINNNESSYQWLLYLLQLQLWMRDAAWIEFSQQFTSPYMDSVSYMSNNKHLTSPLYHESRT